MNELTPNTPRGYFHGRYIILPCLILAAGLSLSAQPVPIDDFNGDAGWDGTYAPRDKDVGYDLIDGQLRIDAPSLRPHQGGPIAYVRYLESLPIKAGYTLELRVDLINMTDTEEIAATIIFHYQGRGYALICRRDVAFLHKYGLGAESRLWKEEYDPTIEPVVLKLRMTRVSNGLELGAQVVSKENPQKIILERSFTDTPDADPVHPSWDPDPGPPYDEPAQELRLGQIQMMQIALRQTQITFDNFEYEYIPLVPPLGVEKAVRLSWPASSEAYQVLGAATVKGPWQEINEPIVELDGMNYLSVPTPISELIKVFQLQKVETP